MGSHNMADGVITNPFGNLSESIAGLAQQRLSPQYAQTQLNFQEAIANQTRQNLANQFLSQADFSRDPAASLRTLGAILNNTDLIKSSLDIQLKQRAFEDQQRQLQQLAEAQGQLGAFAEELAPGGFEPEEQARLFARSLQTPTVTTPSGTVQNFELPNIPSGAKPSAETPESKLQAQQLGLQGKALDIQRKQLELEQKKAAGETPFRFSKEGTDLTIKLQDRAAKRSEDYQVVVNNLANIEAAVDRSLSDLGANNIATHQAIITSYNKILDPTSVVRESEYERTEANQALVKRAEGWFNKISKGGTKLTESDIVEIRDTARAMAELRRQILNKKLEREIRTVARNRNLDPEEIAPLFEPISGTQSETQKSAPATDKEDQFWQSLKKEGGF